MQPLFRPSMRRHSEQLEPAAESRIRRMARIHRINFHLFWIALVLVFGGAAVALLAWQWAVYAFAAGFAIGVVVLLESCLLYPFLKCPRCGRRFFLPNGAIAVFAKIDACQKECLHCGLSLRQSTHHSR